MACSADGGNPGNGPVQAAVTRYAYDANGNLTKITTPKGSEIHRSYDADDRLTEERVLDRKNGIDRRVQYAYDAAGNVLKQAILGTDGECLESSTRYDLKDRATHRTNPAGGVTRYLYDRNDRLRKEISPYGYEPESDDGAGVSYTYDSRGNRLRTTNALGEVVQELSYNLRNQPVIQKDTFGNRTELPTNWTERSRMSGVRGTISASSSSMSIMPEGRSRELWTATGIPFPMTWTAGDASQALALRTG